MPEAQKAPATAPVVNPTPADLGLPSAEAIVVLRGLLDGLEKAAAPKPELVPNQAGTDLVSDLAVTDGLAVAPRGESSLRSSRLWTTICGIGALAGGQFAGLPPITQVCITALAGIYIITRAMTHGGR